MQAKCKVFEDMNYNMTVGVYGLGRFGIFWAEALARYFKVKVFSRTRRESLPTQLSWVEEEELCQSEALFFCVAISSFAEVISRTKGLIDNKTVVFDTCSVKVYPSQIMERELAPSVQVIATHPMFGPDSARHGLKGLPLVFTPLRAKKETISFWEDFFKRIGLNIIHMTPEEHDREAAFTQGITHYIGRVLADLNLKPSSIGTLGYRKLLEIVEQTCNDPWQLFLDIQNYNPYTKEMRLRLHDSLEKIYHVLEKGE